MNDTKQPLDYKSAGVDIAAGEALVERIKPIAKRTKRPEVLAGIGGFGALFELPLNRYKNPVLVSSTDGVGTKLKLAVMANKHDTIGIDLVAMSANDVVVQGAEPLYFLDYYATSHLDIKVAESVIAGIGIGCEQAGMALVGGETAEMPGIYAPGEYDLAGFCVGIVEKAAIIDPSKVAPGDVLIGLPSSGPHSNGYSLIRKILTETNTSLDIPFGEDTLIDVLLAPTQIYVKPLLELFKTITVHAAAHITGGGLIENLPRVMPAYTKAIINKESWEMPEIFQWLQEQGNVTDHEMFRTFNCGIGMVICVAKEDASQAIQILEKAGENAWRIGVVETSDTAKPRVSIL